MVEITVKQLSRSYKIIVHTFDDFDSDDNDQEDVRERLDEINLTGEL